MKAYLYKLKEGWVLCSKEYIEPSSLYLNNGVLFTSDCTYDEGNDPNSSNPRTTDHNYKVLTQSPDFSLLSEEDAKSVGIYYEPVVEAIDRVWSYLNALGYFTSPTDEGRVVENLLIQARIRSRELTADRRFTEEDMINFAEKCMVISNETDTIGRLRRFIEKQFQSLSQPKSWEVEYEEVGGVYKVVEIIKPQLLQ
jgi:ATP-dependent 26S proteasome regulatory subunit